ncbi:MAG: cell division ATP-binding protein FtsE [Gammaproteobacteria bacterium]|nr:cell division ATP-binding protein FtsE [Gammaproteobacteria bacterium]
MIHFYKISKRYPKGQQALSNISFELKVGEMAFLTGHSGSGKSTLLKLIAFLERPTGGEIIVHGKNLNRLKKKHIPSLRRQIGLIFQNPNLLPHRTIFDNVALPLNIAGFRLRETGGRVRAALSKVGLLEKEKCYPDMLSCGEQQRVGIARAIVAKPPIILADEPTGNLDPALSREIMKLFSEFNQAGVTLLVASHDIALIESLPFRILTLKQGQLVHDTGARDHG